MSPPAAGWMRGGVLAAAVLVRVDSCFILTYEQGVRPVKRLIRLGFAIILAAAALVPGSAEAACTIEQCEYLMLNADCSQYQQYVCSPGQVAVPRCNTIRCDYSCRCVTLS